MSQATEQADRLWQEWCDHFDRVYRDLQTMFHDRHVWKDLIAMLEQNSNLDNTAVIKNWIIRSYVDRQCSAIRRLNDSRRDTISFRRCISELIKTPTLVTRTRYEVLATANAAARGIDDDVLHGRGLAGYDVFAGACPDQLDKNPLKEDLDKLANATAVVKTYTDERIAHIGHAANLGALTFCDLDRAIDAVGDLARKYYRLRHPGDTLWYITPQLPASWLTAFEHAWWTSDLQRIKEESLG
jgi:hypothetical protein